MTEVVSNSLKQNENCETPLGLDISDLRLRNSILQMMRRWRSGEAREQSVQKMRMRVGQTEEARAARTREKGVVAKDCKDMTIN
jgi:hypothetical protein